MNLKQHLTYLTAVIFSTVIFFFYMSYRTINSNIDYELGIVNSEGVIDSVYVIRDNFSTPTIFSRNIDDLFFIFGKTVSSDRLFQFQMLKIFLNGEMSKFFGKDKIVQNSTSRLDSIVLKNQHLESDIFIKNLFLDDIADSLLIYLSEKNYSRIKNYCDGINDVVRKSKTISSIPFEIKKDLKSEEWKVKDVLKMYSLFSILTTIDLEKDLFISKLKNILTKEQFLYIAKQISTYSPDESLSKRDIKRQDNLFYESIYTIDNIEKSFLLKDYENFYFSSFFSKRHAYPFYSSVDEVYFQFHSSTKNYPSLYYPVNLINNESDKLNNSFKMNALTIVGLPFPIGAIFGNGNNKSEEKSRENKEFLFLAAPDSTAYSFKKRKITSKIEYRKKIRDIKIEIKNSSNLYLRSFYLEDGFLLSPLSQVEEDSLNNDIEYISFNKENLYESVNFLFSLFFEDDRIASLTNSGINGDKIDERNLPFLNYFFSKSNYKDPIEKYKKTISYINNKRMNDSLIKNELFLSYESSKRFTKLSLGNGFIDKYFDKEKRNISEVDSNSLVSRYNIAIFVFNEISNWNRINIKESRGSFFFNNFISKFIENSFSDEFSQEMESNKNSLLRYLKQNLGYSLNIINDKTGNLFLDNISTIDKVETFEQIFLKSLTDTDTTFNSTAGYGDDIQFLSSLYSDKFNTVLAPLKGVKIKINGNGLSFKKVADNVLPTFIYKISNEVENSNNGNQFIFAGGISENSLSTYYDDQLSFWKDDIYSDFFDLNLSKNLLDESIEKNNYLLIIPAK